MSEWSPVVELLTLLANRLGELTQVVAALGGAKPGRVPPLPAPVTALDRVRHRVRRRKHAALVARVLPHRRIEAPPE
jgi:hypothetical protein